VTDADLVLGRLDPDRFASGRLALDLDAATASLARLGSRLGLEVEATAAAAVRLVDAHMTDAIRRVLSLAGADPRRLDLVAFGGMGGLHATTQAAALGMRRVLVPSAAPGLSALGLLTADHIIDDSRGYIVPWQEADLDRLTRLAEELRIRAMAELTQAGVPDHRIRLEWSILLVYPGQTFDVAVPVDTPTDVPAAVTEFHRRNEEARLIEARAQEPILRGIRLTAVGAVDEMAAVTLEPGATPAPLGHRDMWAADGWQRQAPYYDFATLRPGSPIKGPAAVQSPFTTVIVRPGDVAELTEGGDLLIDVAADSGAL
jgi:N-methylhydantoinase A/oxoprolinase/acetone carboxylase beta subunit